MYFNIENCFMLLIEFNKIIFIFKKKEYFKISVFNFDCF